jgi:lipopolysaccharide transport system permease protein
MRHLAVLAGSVGRAGHIGRRRGELSEDPQGMHDELRNNTIEVLRGTRRISPLGGWWDLGLQELWEYRDLLYFFLWRDIKVRYKQTLIGAAWSILQPLSTMLVFTVFFGMLAKLPSDDLPYPLFYYTGLLPWVYFSGALQQVTSTIVEHQRVITKVYFPRLILPLSAVLPGLVDFAIGCSALIGMMMFYGISPAPKMLLLPGFLFVAVVTALGVGLWLSALNAMYRDVRYVVPVLIQFWMFASPVVYPSSLVPERWRLLYGLNPMAGVIEGFRWIVLEQGQPPKLLLVSLVAVLVVLLSGLVYFNRMEATIADVV